MAIILVVSVQRLHKMAGITLILNVANHKHVALFTICLAYLNFGHEFLHIHIFAFSYNLILIFIVLPCFWDKESNLLTIFGEFDFRLAFIVT